MGTSPEVPCLFLLSAPPKVPRLVGIPSAAPKSGDDVDGTSPGTQAEQALLEAEEQTLAYELRQRLEQRAARFVPTQASRPFVRGRQSAPTLAAEAVRVHGS
jgi:hypothetical protein